MDSVRRLLSASFCCVVLSGAIADAQVIAIAAGTLIDPETGTQRGNQTILVEAGKIKEIGPSVVVPDSALRIDLSGETVLPGLVDAHTHLLSAPSAAR